MGGRLTGVRRVSVFELIYLGELIDLRSDILTYPDPVDQCHNQVSSLVFVGWVEFHGPVQHHLA